MVRSIGCALALVAALTIAKPVFADEPDIAAILDAPDLGALSHDNLAVRLAFRLEPEMTRMMEPMMQIIMSTSAANTSLTSEQRSDVAKIITETFEDNMPLFTRMAAQVYRETYDPGELTGIVQFYESDAGKAFMEKSPQAIEAMSGFMPIFMQRFQADLVQRLKQEAG